MYYHLKLLRGIQSILLSIDSVLDNGIYKLGRYLDNLKKSKVRQVEHLVQRSGEKMQAAIRAETRIVQDLKIGLEKQYLKMDKELDAKYSVLVLKTKAIQGAVEDKAKTTIKSIKKL